LGYGHPRGRTNPKAYPQQEYSDLIKRLSTTIIPFVKALFLLGFYPSIPMNFRPLPWHLLNGPSLCSAVVGGVVATLAVVATVVTFCPKFHNGKKGEPNISFKFLTLENPRLKSYQK